jgi:hypothetical protein
VPPDADDVKRFFIAHSSRQKDFALALREALEEDAWIDLHEIDVGDILLEEIAAGIEAASDFVLLWTRDSASSRWVKYESHNRQFTRATSRRTVPGERLRGLGGGDRFYGKQQRAGRISLIGCTAQLHGGCCAKSGDCRSW